MYDILWMDKNLHQFIYNSSHYPPIVYSEFIIRYRPRNFANLVDT